jgi:integrase
MYLLAVTAGLRCVELSRARVQDFQTVGGRSFLYVWGKWQSEANQKKALAPEVASAIREYLRSRKDKPTANSPLFVSTGNRSGGRPIASTTISKMLKQAMQAAGYDSVRLTAHSLRHTAGTAVYELTHDLYQTQRYIRHSSPITTEIYLHCQDDNQDSELAGRLFKYYENSASATY